MKFLTKAIVIMLIAAVVTNMQCFALPTDVGDTKYEEIIGVLETIGIIQQYEDNTFKADNYITRAEFTVIMTKLVGLSDENIAGATTQIFADVGVNHWANANINAAVGLGIISGYGDGNFAPDDYITYEQAIKMIVYVLGYDVYANQLGGYPMGYLNVAADKGVTNNCDYVSGAYVKRGAAAQMVYNSLSVDLLKPTGFGAKKEYTAEKGKTLLSENLHIEKGTGIITATEDNNVDGSAQRASRDEVIINGVSYITGSTNANSLLGSVVTYYAKVDEKKDERVLIIIREEQKKNEILTVKADDIDESTTVNEFVYSNESGKLCKEKISKGAMIVFNGVEDLALVKEDLMPSSGEVKLVDNNKDGEYDVVFVTSYQTYIVQDVDATQKRIYDKYGRETISFGAGARYTILFKGKQIGLDELSEWDVLCVAADKEKVVNGRRVIDIENSTRYTITAVNNVVSGEVSEHGEDYAVISGKEYEISPNYLYNLEQSPINEKIATLDVGLKGSFFLDSEGKIAAVDKGEDYDGKIGFLVGFAAGQGLDADIEFKIFTSEGNMVILKSSENVKIDGENVKRSKIIEKLKIIKDSDKDTEISRITKKPIIFKTDKDGNVCMLDTTQANSDNVDSMSEINPLTASMAYRFDSRSFSGKFFLDGSTIIMNIPSWDSLNNDDEYSIKGMGDLVNEQSYKVAAYAKGNKYLANLILVVGAATTINDETSITPVTLVEKVTKVMDSEGNTVNKFYGYKSSKKIELLAENNSLLSDVKPGDIIRYATNSKNQITLVQKEFNIATDRIIDNSANANKVMVCGYVYDKQGNIILISTGNDLTSPGTLKPYNLAVKSPIYVYDEAKKSVSMGSINDIYDYKNHPGGQTLVFVHSRYTQVLTIVVYKLQ